jgi:hypothetical protein
MSTLAAEEVEPEQETLVPLVHSGRRPIPAAASAHAEASGLPGAAAAPSRYAARNGVSAARSSSGDSSARKWPVSGMTTLCDAGELLAAWRDEPGLVGVDHGLHAVAEAELAEQV